MPSAAGDREVRPRLTPAMADARRAVRESLASIPAPGPLLVALSGGADSTALAAAVAFEAPRAGRSAGAVVVDHGLQEGSADVADRAAASARSLGLDPVVVVRVEVDGSGGPEGSARDARYRALRRTALAQGAAAVLLGHTLDDQAETVLLGLARGSGTTSLAGMRTTTVFDDDPHAEQPQPVWVRPLLGIRRAETRTACADQGLAVWDDPHNLDPTYARVRVRERVLPVLEAELGPGIAEALARTAAQARDDADAFHAMVLETIEDLVEPIPDGIGVHVRALAANPAALRHRIIRFVVASEFGVSLHRDHTLAVDALVTDWHGQGALDLPAVKVERAGGLLQFTGAAASAAPNRDDQESEHPHEA